MLNSSLLRGALAGAAILGMTITLAACSQTDTGQTGAGSACDATTTIGFSHPVGEAEVVKALKSVLTEKTAELECTEILFDSTTANNLETQRAAIETWITQGIDAIVVSPVDPTALAGLQQQAQAGGIKWLSYGLPLEDADGMVGFDSDASGQLVADAAVAWIEENHPDGDVSSAITTLTPLTAAAGGRWVHPIAAMEDAGVPIVSQQDCADQACGLEITESVLRQHPDLRVFIGFNDDAALGAITAFRNAGVPLEEVFIAGQDGSRGALLAVQEGSMNITAAVDTADLADALLAASLNAINGEGETELMAATRAATQSDPELLARLIAQFETSS